MSDTTTLAPVLAGHIAAVNAFDEDAIVATFAGDALVNDVRRNFDDYLTWRTEGGFTGTFEAMLTRPFVIRHYDIAFFGEGIAARQTT
jgi:hypothetical protein